MRELIKGEEPCYLSANAARLTAEYKASRPDADFSPWRHHEIKDALRDETFAKCAYCESFIEDVSPAHIEHIKPKSRFPELVVDWHNLTFVCGNCNTKKGNYFSDVEPLVNPYVHHPPTHFIFTGALIKGRLTSSMGHRTIKRLGLDRKDLTLSRERHLEGLYTLLQTWQSATGDDKDMYRDTLLEEVGPDQPYSEAGRAFLERFGFPL